MTERTASCSCGQLSIVCTGEPVRISVCHCLACQKRTGSVFGAQARFRSSDVLSISGESSTYVRVADSGNRLTFHFCPRCGSTVHYRIDDAPDLIAIPVGAFADPQFPPPRVSVYESRRHPWVSPPPGDNVEHSD
ncbi:MAG: GFA family protein [Hyphomicrobiales bacterium]